MGYPWDTHGSPMRCLCEKHGAAIYAHGGPMGFQNPWESQGSAVDLQSVSHRSPAELVVASHESFTGLPLD